MKQIKCPLCKANIPSDALRCSHCAGDLSTKEVQEKMIKEAEIRGNPILLGVLLVVALIIILPVIANVVDKSARYSSPKQAEDSSQKITPEKLQATVQGMAQFMVKDDNEIGLRMWARDLGQSAHDFESAESLYEKIRRASNDFSTYNNSENVLNLLKVLSNTDVIFDEVILESLKVK